MDIQQAHSSLKFWILGDNLVNAAREVYCSDVSDETRDMFNRARLYHDKLYENLLDALEHNPDRAMDLWIMLQGRSSARLKEEEVAYTLYKEFVDLAEEAANE